MKLLPTDKPRLEEPGTAKYMNNEKCHLPSPEVPEKMTEEVIAAILAAPIDPADDVISEREYNEDFYD